MRMAMVPENAAKLVKWGAQVTVENGTGAACGYSDADYTAAGATITQDRQAALSSADMVLRLRKPPIEEVGWLKQGCIHISFLDPFNEPELIQKLAAQKVSAISMEMIPRITRAQKMDALTSQANLAGYVAVVLAANHSEPDFPNDDDRCRHDYVGQSVYHRSGRGGTAGHRHGKAARRQRGSF